jgi:hypothetical protein
MKLGPTGEFPRGKLNADDEGAINIAIASDKAQGVIIIKFGTPTAWIGFPLDQAADFARVILKHVEDFRS